MSAVDDGIKLGRANVFVGPDPISSPEMLYAGTLLYFEKPVILTIPPQVVTSESFELLRRIEVERPQWASNLYAVLNAWQDKRERSLRMLELLDPLAKDAFYSVMFAYNADDAALSRAKELLASSGWTAERFLSSIDIANACGELVRHIFLEKYLEFNRDVSALYDVAAHVFGHQDLSTVLASAYCLRLQALAGSRGVGLPVALTNPNLAEFLADLPFPVSDAGSSGGSFFEADAVAMMIFNGLLSKWLDPLDKKRVELLVLMRQTKRDEIDRLKGACLAVSERIDRAASQQNIFESVDREIRYRVLPEVRQVLEVGENAFRDYKEKLFADRIFWTSFISAIGSSLSGSKLISAGAAISTLATMAATAVSNYRDVRQSIRKSDYSLVYSIARSAK